MQERDGSDRAPADTLTSSVATASLSPHTDNGRSSGSHEGIPFPGYAASLAVDEGWRLKSSIVASIAAGGM